MWSTTYAIRTKPVIATICFLPTDELQSSRIHAPRLGASPRSAGMVAGAVSPLFTQTAPVPWRS